MLKEYTSRHYRGQDNYTVTLNHNTSSDGLLGILSNGCIDAHSYHKGECKGNVIWFTAKNDDWGSHSKIQIDVPSQEFNSGRFEWMNDSDVVCATNVGVNEFNFRVVEVGGVDLYGLASKFDLNNIDGFDKFVDAIMRRCGGEIITEEFITQIGRQFNSMNSARVWLGKEEEDNEVKQLTESVMRIFRRKLINY